MIHHAVLLKVRPDATKQELLNLEAGVSSLSSIQGVVQAQCEKLNKTPYRGYADRTKGYTHVIFVVLKNCAALECYDKDPLHQTVKATIIKPLLDAGAENPILAVDWDGMCSRSKPWSCWHVFDSVHGTIAVGLLVLSGILAISYRSRL